MNVHNVSIDMKSPCNNAHFLIIIDAGTLNQVLPLSVFHNAGLNVFREVHIW